jgi:acyl dehydratase
MLTMGMTGRAVTDWVGDGRLTSYGVRFTSQVWPGERLVTRLTIKDVRTDDDVDVVDLDVVTVNSEGAPVISGYATARLDS